NRDAQEVMEAHDGPQTLHYCDPPYVHETRSSLMHGHHGYNHEMNEGEHASLCAFLLDLKGSVIVSGYANDVYEENFQDWHRREISALADGAKDRTEVLWMNENAASQEVFNFSDVTPEGQHS